MKGNSLLGDCQWYNLLESVLAMPVTTSKIFISVKPSETGKKESRTKLLNEVQLIIANKLERTEMLQDGELDKQIMVHSKENVIHLF